MDKTSKVEFRNVGQSYFPQSRVECHYTISPKHSWASNDWIGLFKVGWTSLRDYHTFVWALAPSGYQEGTSVNCCVNFQASYLPGPSEDAFQFVYVDRKGAVCAGSSQFTFCAPKPLEELVTLEGGAHGEEEGADLLVVVPRAELLQSRLEEILRERSDLLQAKDAAEKAKGKERALRERAKEHWDKLRRELEDTVSELKEKLLQNQEKISAMEKEQQGALSSQMTMRAEIDNLLAESQKSQQQISDLEDNIKALTLRGAEREAELERMRERIKKMAALKREDEEDRKSLQEKLVQTEDELRSLSAEFQQLRSSLAQRDTQALQLRDTITTLTNKLHAAQRRELESEASLTELQGLQERLVSSERVVESLKGEMSAMAAKRDKIQAEVHQARLQVAQLTLQLADTNLALREGRATWAQERETLQQSVQTERDRLEKLTTEIQRKEEWLQEEKMEREKTEVELGREKDCNRVQLSEARRELQELKASLRVAQKEKEQLYLEKQEILVYMRQLEQRLDAVADAKWKEAAFAFNSRPDSPTSESEEDESPEALQGSRPPRPLGSYGLCEPPPPEALPLGTPPQSPRELCRRVVVISQPAPLSSPRQPTEETLPHSSDSEEELEMVQSESQSSGEETALLLPDHTETIQSELSDPPMW